MQANDSQFNQSQLTRRDLELYEKSKELRTYSIALLNESRDLCNFSRKLRAINKSLGVNNVNPNSRWKREPIQELALQVASRPKVSYSIDVSLRQSEQDSNVQHLKVLDERKLLY